MMETILKSRGGGIVVALVSCVLWGSAYPVLKTSFEMLGVTAGETGARMAFAGMRFFLASLLILGGYHGILKEKIRNRRQWLRRSLVLGLFQTSFLYYFFYNGLAVTSGMKSAILIASGSFFLVILAHFFQSNDRISTGKVLGLLAGFAGIVAVNWGEQLTWEFTFSGEGFLILASLSAAVGDLLTRSYTEKLHPFELTGGQMLTGSLLLLWLGRADIGWILAQMNLQLWGLFVYSAVLSAVAFSLWFSLLKHHRAGELAMYKFMMPVAGTLLSALILPGESLSTTIWIGLGLVSTGIVIVNGEGRQIDRIEAAKALE